MKDYRGMIAALYDEIDRCKDKRLLYGRRLLLAWVEANVTGVTRLIMGSVLLIIFYVENLDVRE